MTVQTNHDEININETDEIADMIKQDGYLPNKQLWRRWIMTQTLRFHNNKNICPDSKSSFDKHFMENKPYKYAWDTTLKEMEAIAKIPENSEDRARLMFYNKDVVLDMLDEYIAGITEQLQRLEKQCHYITFANTKLVVLFDKSNLKPTEQSINNKHRIMTRDEFLKELSDIRYKIYKTASYRQIASTLAKFIKIYPMAKLDMPKPEAWKNAFHGAGAYYTMDNMIKFYNCVIYNHTNEQVYPLSRENSLKKLNELARSYSKENSHQYQFDKLFDMMKQFVKDNNFSIDNLNIDYY